MTESFSTNLSPSIDPEKYKEIDQNPGGTIAMVLEDCISGGSGTRSLTNAKYDNFSYPRIEVFYGIIKKLNNGEYVPLVNEQLLQLLQRSITEKDAEKIELLSFATVNLIPASGDKKTLEEYTDYMISQFIDNHLDDIQSTKYVKVKDIILSVFTHPDITLTPDQLNKIKEYILLGGDKTLQNATIRIIARLLIKKDSIENYCIFINAILSNNISSTNTYEIISESWLDFTDQYSNDEEALQQFYDFVIKNYHSWVIFPEISKKISGKYEKRVKKLGPDHHYTKMAHFLKSLVMNTST